VLKKTIEPWVDKLAVERAFGGDEKLRHFASTNPGQRHAMLLLE